MEKLLVKWHPDLIYGIKVPVDRGAGASFMKIDGL